MDMVQIREKDLSGLAWEKLAQRAVGMAEVAGGSTFS